MTEQEVINNYLYFGYLPNPSKQDWLFESPSMDFIPNYSVKEASHLFDEIFNELLEKYPSKKHLVPLSGGWDSRGVLGALIERLDKKNIETITFGAPGQLDYDLGLNIAKELKIKSHALNLTEIEFTWEKIVSSAKKSPWTYIPDVFFNQTARDLFADEGSIIWTGFLGDSLSGSKRYNVSDFNDPIDVFRAFLKKEKKSKLDLCESSFSHECESVIQLESEALDLIDYFDLSFRQRNIAKIITPVKSWDRWNPEMGVNQNGALVLAPFTDLRFKYYWFRAPLGKRENQRLYLDMLKSKFPELFSMPSKYSFGIEPDSKFKLKLQKYKFGLIRRLQSNLPFLGIRNTSHLNYLDFDVMLREREDYIETMSTALEYLKFNNVTPWLDLNRIWTNHQKRKEDNGKALLILLGLAANLESNGLKNIY